MIDTSLLEIYLSDYIDMVGQEYDLNKKSQEDLTTLYESLIAGSLAIRSLSHSLESNSRDFSKVIPVIKIIIEWLRKTDFYSCPASTKYHGACPCGLLVHSLRVYNHAMELTKIKHFNEVNKGSATLMSLCHDWCKIDRYETYFKNVKNPLTHVWEEQPAYRCKENSIGLGHGPQSLVMITQLCNTKETYLSFDEMAAIRWHMYTYDVTSYDINDLNKCSSIPLVMLIQFSDQMAASEE